MSSIGPGRQAIMASSTNELGARLSSEVLRCVSGFLGDREDFQIQHPSIWLLDTTLRLHLIGIDEEDWLNFCLESQT